MRIPACLLLAVLLAGCANPAPRSNGRTANADAAFNHLADDYLAGYLAWRPGSGVYLGLHQYDGLVTDYSKASIDAELARLKSFDQRMAGLDTAQLSPQAFFDYRLLRGAIQREIFSFVQQEAFTKNPMSYSGAVDVNIYIKRDFAPLPDRVRSVISILRHAPDIMAAARANLADSLPRPLLETAVEEADGAADFLGKDLVEALKDVKDPALTADFNAANQRAIAEMRGYSTFLKEQKLPKASEDYALGREKYIQMLKCGEMLSQSPEQILELGLRELARKHQVFAGTARLIDPSRPAIDVFRAIQKDHPTEQSLIPDTTRDLESIRQFVANHHIISLPSQVRARTAATPQFLRASSFASMDTPGPFETKATEAYYYITPVEPDWPDKRKEEWLAAFNYYTTDIVSIHEAYPGHYVQFLHLNASRATRIEKIFNSYAFTEGWAHYCEQMLVDEGFGASASPTPTREEQIRAAKYRLAQTDEALLRVCRLCVSIKMHCQGMKVDEAAKFFEDNCYFEASPAHSEAMRGTFDPEYLYYTVGKLELLKLREDYRKQQGADFSLQKFHDALLNHGAPPVRLLREVMLKDPATWDEVL
jgi:uncharacterized protein (DUF885 family)